MSRFLQPRFRHLAVYTPGEQPRDRQYVKLNTNESPYPPAPGVLHRLEQEGEAAELHLYSDPECTRLRALLAERCGVTPEQVFVSNGSDEALSFAFMAFTADGGKVAFPDISYGFYRVFADLYGAQAEEIPLRDDLTVNPDDYLGGDRTIFLANPNAPTGLSLPRTEIERILQANPNRVVVIDEAYVDFGGQSCLPLIPRYENLLVVQTFSKSRSLAGARIGFAVGSRELIDDLRRIQYATNPYNVDRLAQAAGEAALLAQDYYDACCREIMQTRARTAARLRALGFVLQDSQTNFLFARLPGWEGGALNRALRQKGILVRHFDRPRIRDNLRITIGSPAQMDRLIEALQEIIKEKKEGGDCGGA